MIETPPPIEYAMNRLEGLRFFLERSNFGRTISVMIATRANEDTGEIGLASSIQFQMTKENEAYRPEAPLRLTLAEAQQLMDELWHCGVRPSDVVVAD